MSRDVSFVENEFPFVQREHDSVEPRSLTLTGGLDDDWIIPVVASDRSDPVISEVVSNENVSCLDTVADQSTPQEQSVASENEVTEVVTAVVEPEMGRGCREKKPSTRLRDFVNYNAHCVQEEPHHNLTTSIQKSESSSIIPGSTLYPITNYISDNKFSHAHKTFLAAITSGNEPKNYKEAVQQKI